MRHIDRLAWGALLAVSTLVLATGWMPVTQQEGETEDPSGIVIENLHIRLAVADGRLTIQEHYLLSNDGELTYVGAEDPATGRRATIGFAMPAAAENLSFEAGILGERFLEWDGGFADTEPIPPGSATLEVIFRYEVDYQEGLLVERSIDVPMASVVLLLPQGDLVLQGDGLRFGGSMDSQTGPVIYYTAGPLEAGESLLFAVVPGQPPEEPPLPAPQGAVEAPSGGATTSLPSGGDEGLGIGLIALAVAGLVVYIVRSRPPAVPPLPEEIRPLVERIAALDVAYEQERIDDRVYDQRRQAIERRIRVLLSDHEVD